MADTVGQQNLRAENVERVVKGIALQSYKFKQLCMISNSNSWKESYYREDNTELTGGTGAAIKGIPRLAKFPNLEPNWTKTSSYLEKYGGEGIISWEDAKTNEIDVIARTLLRIGRAIAKAVDDQIWTVIADGPTATPSNINYVTITAGNEWNSATIANRDPIQDVLNAIKEISIDNYDTLNGNGYLCISPTDYANLLGNANVRNAGQFYTADATKNGKVGRLCGLNVLVSNSVTADYALVIVGKEAATWKSAHALSVQTIEDPGVKYTIRGWEVGVTQLINPKACCLIVNTQA